MIRRVRNPNGICHPVRQYPAVLLGGHCPVETVRRGVKHAASARFEINADEAAIIGRIFRDYAAGQSMQTIAFALNR